MKINLLILAILCLFGYGLTYAFYKSGPTLSKPSDFSFTDAQGQTLSLAEFRGKIVLVNFWASWCAPCIKEFPNLIELARQYPEDVVLLALSWDTDEASMNRFLKKQEGWRQDNIIITLDSSDVGGKIYGISKLPETFIIDKKGRVAAKLIGASWEKDAAEKTIEGLR